MQQLKVCELFAGVGGFRLGLERTNRFEVVWSNQWEPSTKMQHASLVYEARFGKENHCNANIETVKTEEIPDHDMLVGGFPCQDYSVATSLKNSKGLIGKKGVLWWSIHRILSEKKNKPSYLFLENVDRLLKSPSTQRGRDFAVMLRSLSDLGYAVEWRVINAAEYGMPQRRRRVFFLAYFKGSKIHQKMKNSYPEDWILHDGIFSEAFPVAPTHQKPTVFDLDEDLVELSSNFNSEKGLSPFLNTGICVDGKVTTLTTSASYDGNRTMLSDILEQGNIPSEYYIDEADLPKWDYLKGSKKEIRKTKAGFEYHYSEGSMVFPDALDQPSRTIITGEGGKSPSRFKHVVQTSKGLRRLLPVELERLNMFPDHHTQLEGISDAKRAFFMGNALVVGIVEKIGASLFRKIDHLEKQLQS
ncbi:MAG: DNA (cytosine-5-)-methyltransferase [Muricauda sp.]|nr:DNA (cytosine-5-)-methyltransferase [Allomuricauda sp.]MBO6587975.1 DNA (cytosine-5-)-methyltransferase [Allomuricauda sp.]MBO6617600.1 DNA (cytosine-5-)-methyltransferase [Allomuricauda sp.]MBO6643389.1 DNA (cytosine-5-)-methyltransferase [Allomuricauda sp.]MBO6745935.1 DNA (cytosine-5-)-methyltransferase [Allomuricauda sp.]MBO6828242.1 DNA (cytosine-5-)-methyltransferase [Allomuricauda sp.]